MEGQRNVFIQQIHSHSFDPKQYSSLQEGGFEPAISICSPIALFTGCVTEGFKYAHGTAPSAGAVTTELWPPIKLVECVWDPHGGTAFGNDAVPTVPELDRVSPDRSETTNKHDSCFCLTLETHHLTPFSQSAVPTHRCPVTRPSRSDRD